MKIIALTLAACHAAPAVANADALCAAAQAALEKFAQHRGLSADVRCRMSPLATVPKDAKLSAMDWTQKLVPRTGMMTWPVRVEAVDGSGYLRQVPLTVAWTAPAWVATRSLRPGADLQSTDCELKATRWPDGLAVQAADPQSSPQGRLRHAHRPGDVLTAASLLPAGVLMRGDAVTAVLVQGALEIRMPARLISTSRVGELTRVQAPGTVSLLEGRLLDMQTLLVVSQ